MRAPLCVVAVWIVLTACAPSEPPETAGGGAPATNGTPPAARPAVDAEREAPGEQDGADGNPLISLLEQDIAYGEGLAGNLVGFLAVPEDVAEPLPGVIVLHEWWGLNDSIREVSRRIAREDYVVLAVDLYGGRAAATVPEAQALLRELVETPDLVRENIRQAYEYLARYALAPRIGAVGWDLGGRWSLQTALMLPDQLDAMVMFYGAVETDEAAIDTLNMPMLGLFGERDRSIPVRDVQAFRGILGRLGKPAEVRIYSNVEHGFFFPGSPAYNPIAADDAWLRCLNVLRAGLKE